MALRLFILCVFAYIVSACDSVPKISNSADVLNDFECRDTTSSIIGGRSVLVDEKISKDAVLLLIRRGDKLSSCTGALISPRLILTAAHCVNGANADNVTAIFHTNMKCKSGYNRDKVISSVNYVTHDGFDGTPQSNADLAVVRLSKAAPPDYPVTSLYDGSTKLSSDELLLLGFGITDETKHDGLELRTTSKSISKDTIIKEKIIGIVQSGKTGGFCRGDSGAPLYVTVGGVKKIIGINSYNIGTDTNNECHTSSVAMYVPYFTSWIKTQILDL